MKIINNHEYESLAKFYYKNVHYEMFKDDQGKLAFLVIDKDGKYHYPEVNDVFEITNSIINTKKPGMMELVNDTNDNYNNYEKYYVNYNNNISKKKNKKNKVKKYKFIPKLKRGAIFFALSASFLATILSLHKPKDYTYTNNNYSYEKNYDYDKELNEDSKLVKEIDEEISKIQENNKKIEETTQTNQNTEASTEQQTIEEDNEIEISESSEYSRDDFNNRMLLQTLSVADDELDYEWANDYYYDGENTYKLSDSKAYSSVFGFEKPTSDALKKAVESNKKISRKYKDFINDYIDSYLTLYPDADLSVFYVNLQSLKVNEVTPKEIQDVCLSSDAIACYVPKDNEIYVNNTIDFSQHGSRDWITLAHELTHAARTTKMNYNNNEITARFYDNSDLSVYADEAIDTNIMYELASMNGQYGEKQRSTFYTMSCNYYRIIQDCLGDSYTGADYMNHSVNYLMEQMDKYMGDDNYAYHMINMIDVEMSLHYNEYVETDITSFQELFDYITKMYCKKYLKAGMSQVEAEQVFTNLMGELTFNFENLNSPYPEITEDRFRPAFEQCANDLGINLEQTQNIKR